MKNKPGDLSQSEMAQYRKIPKISPRGLYFSKVLFEGQIFGGGYLRSEICVLKSIGLAL